MNFEKLLNQFALLISRVFHPFIVSVPAGLLLLYLADISLLESMKWISISAVMTIVPTALFMKFHPNYNVRETPPRESRNLLYLVGLIEFCGLTAVVSFLQAPEIVIMLSYSSILLTLIGGMINRFTKVSLHVGVLSGFSTAINFLSPSTGALCFTLTLMVAWSRLKLERHTLQQVFLGLLIPAFCIALLFQILI